MNDPLQDGHLTPQSAFRNKRFLKLKSRMAWCLAALLILQLSHAVKGNTHNPSLVWQFNKNHVKSSSSLSHGSPAKTDLLKSGVALQRAKSKAKSSLSGQKPSRQIQPPSRARIRLANSIWKYETIPSDLIIRGPGSNAWIGRNILSPDATDEEAEHGVEIGESVTFDVRVLRGGQGFWQHSSYSNEGRFIPRWLHTAVLKDSGSAIIGWSVRYYDQGGDDYQTGHNYEVQDITGQVMSSQGWTIPNDSFVFENDFNPDRNHYRPGRNIRIELTPKVTVGVTNATTRSALLCLFSDQGNSSNPTNVVDAVLATSTSHPTPSVDAMIRNGRDEDYIGDQIYNTTGQDQTKNQGTSVGIPAIYTLKIQSNVAASDVCVKAPGSGLGWSAKYFDALIGGSDITAAIIGAGWSTGELEPGGEQPGGQREIRVEVSLDQSMVVGTPAELKVTIVSVSSPSRVDVVKASTGIQQVAGLEYSFDRVTWTPIVPRSADPNPTAPNRMPRGGAFDEDTTSGPTTPDTDPSTTPDFSVMEGQSFGLRAAKGDPSLSWPSNMDTRPFPYLKPAWAQEGRKNVGEEIWAMYPTASVNDTDLKTITVECGNSLSVKVKVLPTYSLFIASSTEKILSGGGDKEWVKATLTATVKRWDGSLASGKNVRFSVKRDGGADAGVITSADNGGDTVTTAETGQAAATLTSDSFVGTAHASASLVGENGQDLRRSSEIDIIFADQPNIQVTPIPQPGPAPTASTLSVSALTFGEIPLSWTIPQSGGFHRYELHRSTITEFEPSEQTLIASVLQKDAGSYSDAGIDAEVGGVYFYKLVTYNTDNRRAISNEVSVQIPLTPPIPTQIPTLSRNGTIGHDVVSLSWTQESSDVFASYEFHRSTVANFVPSEATLLESIFTSSEVTYQDYSVEPVTTYYYKVVVNTLDLKHRPATALTSNEVSAQTLVAPTHPSPADVVLSLKNAYPNRAVVEWTQADGPAFETYELHRSTAATFTPSGLTLIADVSDAEENTFRDSGLTPGSTYYYKIVGHIGASTPVHSNEVTVPLPALPTPTTPTAVQLSLNALTLPQDVQLAWTGGPATDFAYAEVHRSLTPNFTKSSASLIEKFNWPDEQSTIDYGLAFGSTYYYKTVAYSLSGQESVSNEVSVTVPNAPELADITLSVHGDATEYEVPLQWTEQPKDQFDHYELHRSTTAQFIPSAASSINDFYMPGEIECMDTTVSPGTTYYYKVVVVGKNQQIKVSNEIQVTTPNALEE